MFLTLSHTLLDPGGMAEVNVPFDNAPELQGDRKSVPLCLVVHQVYSDLLC